MTGSSVTSSGSSTRALHYRCSSGGQGDLYYGVYLLFVMCVFLVWRLSVWGGVVFEGEWGLVFGFFVVVL